ncbi:hypothetical protein DAEQUDRAFT_727300 [Daedalea quercina L-15889]|uniref:Uncharacterized protein n=1 Tax=Daedalea quercina L-15889 TaxID=1314783 RepID=A0A165Q119_9APHY|nr:hypothetical protein DAEQUDRAFT_727300 [Daedalea quercina L-15889]
MDLRTSLHSDFGLLRLPRISVSDMYYCILFVSLSGVVSVVSRRSSLVWLTVSGLGFVSPCIALYSSVLYLVLSTSSCL